MRVILDLDEIVLGKLQFKADAEKRSRKNYMEVALQDLANGNNPIIERRVDYSNNLKDESKWADATPFNEPKQVEVPLDKVSQFCQNIFHADSKKEIEKYLAQAKKELDWKKQVTINSYAAEIMEKKGFVYND